MNNVLTIAGSDSLAGGGLQADLKTFEEFDLFGVSVITSVASIFEDKVQIKILDEHLLESQLDSIITQMKLSAIKIGLVGDVDNVQLIADKLSDITAPLILDPVLVFKEGSTDCDKSYLQAIKRLLPKALVVTPNLVEAQKLSGRQIESLEDMKQAAKDIQDQGCPNVVIKGGSRMAGHSAVDYLLTENGDCIFKNPKANISTTNGAGCTFSAAVASGLAKGNSIENSVEDAKSFVYAAIVHGNPVGSVWQAASRNFPL
ncbi:bifunctional hydroxymethylpyrimidine kinase/phosphomethylpyrimidine kinase [Companilactobacillus furfuricola]|uniref:bifunctional hydroxymethylpyrimidine kinase/phosphomethylpyrimidine kinase n=1 Tax=Companilactobacillus furfuricola TaxID=1462575 RepID=UPI000F7B2EFE|nr:bifunctional hydroxymethylpyrimidine kinase/phosphomethylpyrimidine kinase [Companilactobacillus furfuricola]